MKIKHTSWHGWRGLNFLVECAWAVLLLLQQSPTRWSEFVPQREGEGARRMDWSEGPFLFGFCLLLCKISRVLSYLALVPNATHKI
jgi:hypothetical protein